VDAWAFERLCAAANPPVRADPEPGAGETSTLAAGILGLYLGPFLREEEASWAIARRERLRSKLLRAGAALGARLEGARHFEQAADLYRRALESDPLAEEFHRGLMRCLQAQGRVAEALDAYRRCRDILSVTLGVQPSDGTQALYRSVRPVVSDRAHE
jgi:two-component SAPR family response regulator